MSQVNDSPYEQTRVGIGADDDAIELPDAAPFQILIAGDFSGRAWRKAAEPRALKPVLVDRDNFEELMEELEVGLDIAGVKLKFAELEDFHPDRLQSAVQTLVKSVQKAQASAPAAPPPSPARKTGAGLLDEIVGEQAGPAPVHVKVEDANDLASFISKITAGHLVKADPEGKRKAAERDAAAAEVLRAVLHHPRFQALESAWRALFLLIRRLDTDGDLKIYLLDATLPELVGQAKAVSQTLKTKGRWALVAANYEFGLGELEVKALERLGLVARSVGAPLVAEVKPAAASEDPTNEWRELRGSDLASWIGLMLPRFLIRLPYGRHTEPIESFAFEEMPAVEHNRYLWASPIFAFALLLGQSFLSYGRNVGRQLDRRIGGLPLHVHDVEGEKVAQPCAEVLMTEREAERLLDAGFMPLASIKSQDAVLLVRYQSIAKPAAALSGLQR